MLGLNTRKCIKYTYCAAIEDVASFEKDAMTAM